MGKEIGSIIQTPANMQVETDEKETSPVSMDGAQEPSKVDVSTDMPDC